MSWVRAELGPLLTVRARTADAQWSLFSLKSRSFGLRQTNWADKFWGIWGISGRTISTHFGTVSPLFMFSIIQLLVLQKKLSIFIHIPNIFLGLGFEFEFVPQRIRYLAFSLRVSVVCVLGYTQSIHHLWPVSMQDSHCTLGSDYLIRCTNMEI